MTRILIAVWIVVLIVTALARQGVDWDAIESSPEVKQWYRQLMQPDNRTISCCGEADAYWADSFEVEGDQYVAIITDERDDKPLGRPHIAPGTRVVVPNNKLKFDEGNPTGHGVIFMNTIGGVYCYVVPGGI